jgi:ATP-dependent DNA helicase RecQ
MMRISGVGEKKLADYGIKFLEAIRDHVALYGCKQFDDQPLPPQPRRRLNETSRETLQLFRNGRSVAQITADRGLVAGTIYTHLANAIEAGENVAFDRLLSAEQKQRIDLAFEEFGLENLAGVLERLGEGFDYGMLKVYRAVKLKNNPVDHPRRN